MPKRINNIYHRICDISNIEAADLKARKCKCKTYGVIRHDKHRDEENKLLSEMFKNMQYKTSPYTTYKIYEPKERLIFRLPYFPDRIAHHAIMNVMEPIWTKIFTRDTYSCIKNRGIHALLKKLSKDLVKDPKGTKYCLKLDITKFYPSIDHDVLKRILRKKIKDKQLLQLLDEIIDSAEGVPIGNYLSQFFANLYLTYFDHWVKEELKVKYYYRYADDIVILCDNKQQLRSWFLAIKIYLSCVLKLTVKGNYQIFPVDSRGINFVGYIFYHNHIKLRKSIKHKLLNVVKNYKENKITHEDLEKALASYYGWLKFCNSKKLIQKITNTTGIKYTGWNGKRTIISNIYGKYIYVVVIQLRKRYFLIQYIKNARPYECKSSSRRLLSYIMSFNHFPIIIKIKKYV